MDGEPKKTKACRMRELVKEIADVGKNSEIGWSYQVAEWKRRATKLIYG